MQISEIFYSLQGEGRLTGMRSVFIRLAGCNLRCWWCDTPYALTASSGREQDIRQVLDQIATWDTPYVVVTGGEPLIAKDLPELLAELKSAGKHITVETAGTRYVEISCDLLSISPKLAHSTPPADHAFAAYADSHEKQRIQTDVLQRYIDTYDYQLKFVVSTVGDLAEIEALLSRLHNVQREQVMLMPQGRTKADLRRTGPQVARWCLENNFSYCPRLQIELWGNKKGT